MAGSIGAAIEQKRDKIARRRDKPAEKPTKVAKPRENEVVDHGFRAVIMIYQLTNRVPALIEQSHLERKEDPIGMSDTRVQAANLLCKIFLHYLVLLSEWDGMLDLWLRILDVLDRLMNSGQGDNLEEAVPESLKNILLVMADGGYIKPPIDGQERTQMWDETVKRVDRFVPELIGEIFPRSKEVPSTPEPVQVEKEKVEDGQGTEDEKTAVEEQRKAPPPPSLEEVQDGGVD
ncbi:hypothetical protein P7C71_g2824, partial [Lecanoromycetidae sp. Uapishka_2]